jgi:hypothetical protein
VPAQKQLQESAELGTEHPMEPLASSQIYLLMAHSVGRKQHLQSDGCRIPATNIAMAHQKEAHLKCF